MDISAIITTYNHEKYIAQCLESILKQEGDFQMEVIVGDDASTDGTRRIAEQFQALHPEVVFLLPPEKNLGITKNLKRCLDACTGQYIAICEGDDYWTDVYKLQKQKDFLDQHHDFSMCFSAYVIFFEETGDYKLHEASLHLEQDILTTRDLVGENYIGNFSCCMYRRQAVEKISKEIFEFFVVDWMFNMACGQFGKIGFLRDWMSIYRKHSQGVWSGKTQHDQFLQLHASINEYNKLLNYEYDAEFSKRQKDIELAFPELFAQTPGKNAKNRSQKALFGFIKRHSPDFVIRLYHKLIG